MSSQRIALRARPRVCVHDQSQCDDTLTIVIAGCACPVAFDGPCALVIATHILSVVLCMWLSLLRACETLCSRPSRPPVEDKTAPGLFSISTVIPFSIRSLPDRFHRCRAVEVLHLIPRMPDRVPCKRNVIDELVAISAAERLPPCRPLFRSVNCQAIHASLPRLYGVNG